VSALSLYPVDISELIVVSDVVASGFGYGISESIIVSNTQTVQVDFVSSLLEAVAASDNQTISTAFPVNIDEAGIEVSDNFIGLRGTDAAFSDTIVTSDALAAQRFTFGIIAESIRAISTQTATGIFRPSISENITISSDAVFAYLWNPIPDAAQGNFQPINTTSVPAWGDVNTAVNANFALINTAVNANFAPIDTSSVPNFDIIDTV
jgi:hypothetical protein